MLNRTLSRRLAAAVLLLALPACAGAPRASAPERTARPYVVLVSFDGFRHDYLDRGLTPTFARLERAGARADGLIPAFPSKTFPNHYSVVTGMYTARHGLVANDFYHPGRGAEYHVRDRAAVEDGSWYGGEPIWVTAERQGVRAASYFWPGSEAAIDGVRPSTYKIYDGGVANAARVDSVLAWFRRPAAERPRIATLYFSIMDDAGHAYGPDSPEVDSALVAADAVLGRLLDGVDRLPQADSVYLVVVSDHGMTSVDPDGVEYLDDHADLEGVRVVNSGPFAFLYTGGAARTERVRAALAAGLERARVYRPGETPARWHFREGAALPDLVVVAGDHGSVALREAVGRGVPGGNHGYAPEVEAMHGIFLARGPAIRPGTRIDAFENVHVYPFLARLLKLRPNPEIDGSAAVLAPILR